MSHPVTRAKSLKEQKEVARTNAIIYMADGKMSHHDIATKVGIERRTLYRWMAEPDFQAAVHTYRKKAFAAVEVVAIIDRQQRVLALNDRWQRMRRVIEERAADPTMANVPGGKTGLLVKRVRWSSGRALEEYQVDTGLLSEMRATEEQAARECGQWEDKHRLAMGEEGGYELQELFILWRQASLEKAIDVRKGE